MSEHMNAWRKAVTVAAAATMAGALVLPTAAGAQALRLGAASVPPPARASTALATERPARTFSRSNIAAAPLRLARRRTRPWMARPGLAGTGIL